jgi:hypothetical protein
MVMPMNRWHEVTVVRIALSWYKATIKSGCIYVLSFSATIVIDKSLLYLVTTTADAASFAATFLSYGINHDIYIENSY